MAKSTDSQALVPVEQIERSIHVIREQRVMPDFDLAKLYGIPTKRLKAQVRRNRDRFPVDFAFPLTPHELRTFRSQISTSSSDERGHRYRPFAFIEYGVAMLASVLRTPMAVRVNIEIVRAFVRLRRLPATSGKLVEQLRQWADTVQLHDVQIKEIARVLQQLIARPDPPLPKRKLGFQPPTKQGET